MRHPISAAIWFTSSLLLGVIGFWWGSHGSRSQISQSGNFVQPSTADFSTGSDSAPTALYAHNLLLRKGPHFRVYIRWIRGQFIRTQKDRNPSLDAPESFLLEIQKGVISAQFKDIADFLNSGMTGTAPLKNITLGTNKDQLVLKGTFQKIVPLPVELDGRLIPLPDGRLNFHTEKISVLKVPFKGLLSAFKVSLKDLVPSKTLPGLDIANDDLIFDTQSLLPPPHIQGHITSIEVKPEELLVIYGGARNDESRLAQWRNFLQFSGGTLDFGKLTMHQVDLTMIDASDDKWFDLDLVNYQAQLIYGTSRLTPKSGLEIYMPDLDAMPPRQTMKSVSLEWLKNRAVAPPIAPTQAPPH